jgi:hypothetical protein
MYQGRRYIEAATAFAFIVLFTRTSGQIPVRASSIVVFYFLLVQGRVSFETSFDSKRSKIEPKLVLALSETKHLFRLFRFFTETESFDVLIEPKQTED